MARKKTVKKSGVVNVEGENGVVELDLMEEPKQRGRKPTNSANHTERIVWMCSPDLKKRMDEFRLAGDHEISIKSLCTVAMKEYLDAQEAEGDKD